jgi:hypothetical protein
MNILARIYFYPNISSGETNENQKITGQLALKSKPETFQII